MKNIELEKGKRKIAVLGDMLELGDLSQIAHREVGFKVVENEIDYLITVGKESQAIAEAAQEAGLAPENIKRFEKADKAGQFLKDIMNEGDLILVKGSQGIRMEKIVFAIMAEPEKASELLVRQTDGWENK
jgi:UDP-N-acetylmuramoyl-tripeptide--D-alanyl-D-alanine ligase